ncbi:hypothetical protein GLOTRDRAFT_129400 [Gloeophyllum trabeum ATCC 11539]|uniref:Fungal-type protein kinase domain-containing protein n=1 Tax=Gloeophyllum trabeum (strain ATCC 11539 / FP-39264 / Madison 617) TaxID=670483 RepID=S7Q6Q7_GLOTA|nr:uncharacterized protein GLOTRDRAFT_129400 [Gloeophyllum trabeum ATCC 11539]EPQ55108.1 hypothetical protein GLOTRDRAFT_129400 [Gloeophyllum trabeum ATCC 11539]
MSKKELKYLTGTIQFLSIERLQENQSDHKSWHDLESVFWTVLWAVLRHTNSWVTITEYGTPRPGKDCVTEIFDTPKGGGKMIFLTLGKVEVEGNVPLTNCLAKLRFLVYTKYVRDPEIKALLRQEAEDELKDRISHESFLKVIEDALEDRSKWPRNDGAKEFKPAGRPRTEENTETGITLSQRISWYTSSRDRTHPGSNDPGRFAGMAGSGSGTESGAPLRYDTHTSRHKESSSRISRPTTLQAVEERAPGEPLVQSEPITEKSGVALPGSGGEASEQSGFESKATLAPKSSAVATATASESIDPDPASKQTVNKGPLSPSPQERKPSKQSMPPATKAQRPSRSPLPKADASTELGHTRRTEGESPGRRGQERARVPKKNASSSKASHVPELPANTVKAKAGSVWTRREKRGDGEVGTATSSRQLRSKEALRSGESMRNTGKSSGSARPSWK